MPFGFGWITQYVGLTPFISGDKYQPLKLIDQWYNVLICYDIFFPERYLRFGNRPMILLLDDHWYKNSWVREYHFRQAQVVSLILGQNLVSSSADGVSGFIEGGQIHLLDTKVQGFISKSLKVFDHTNQAWLHWLDTACRLLAILGIVIYSLDAISGRKRVKTKQL
jgi:apolipoprotein N-acyltransferase